MTVAKILAIVALLASFQTFAYEAVARGGGRSTASSVHVQGYVRKNGTHVQGHYRSAPDGNFANNWTTKGNINPHTGAHGTLTTPPVVRQIPRLYGYR